MKTEFFDAVFIFKDEDGKDHQERHHVKSFDKVLKILFGIQKAGINLTRIRIYEFFGTEMTDSISKEHFWLIPGYNEYKKIYDRDEAIESLGI